MVNLLRVSTPTLSGARPTQEGEYSDRTARRTGDRRDATTSGPQPSIKEPHSIQAVSRTLSLLRELNLKNGATVPALAAAVHLPRGTVYRMMENLRALGYVRKDPHISGYWITERCQELGNGYADQQWVLDIGNKVVNRLHEETKLGVVLTTPNGENMIVRIATILRNSAGGHRTTAGTLIPMGQCCSGHSYLAHGSRDLRQNLLDDLYTRAEHDKNFTPFVHNQVALKRILAEKLLDGIRTQGYAMGHAWADGSGRLGVVAVPIMRDEDVVGSLSLNFFYSSLKATALGDLLALLKNAALEIGSSAAPMRHSQAAE